MHALIHFLCLLVDSRQKDTRRNKLTRWKRLIAEWAGWKIMSRNWQIRSPRHLRCSRWRKTPRWSVWLVWTDSFESSPRYPHLYFYDSVTTTSQPHSQDFTLGVHFFLTKLTTFLVVASKLELWGSPSQNTSDWENSVTLLNKAGHAYVPTKPVLPLKSTQTIGGGACPLLPWLRPATINYCYYGYYHGVARIFAARVHCILASIKHCMRHPPPDKNVKKC